MHPCNKVCVKEDYLTLYDVLYSLRSLNRKREGKMFCVWAACATTGDGFSVLVVII